MAAQVPPELQALLDAYQNTPGGGNGIPTELMRWAQSNPGSGIDVSGNNLATTDPMYNFYNQPAGKTPGVDWWYADDRNNPNVKNAGGPNATGVGPMDFPPDEGGATPPPMSAIPPESTPLPMPTSSGYNPSISGFSSGRLSSPVGGPGSTLSAGLPQLSPQQPLATPTQAAPSMAAAPDAPSLQPGQQWNPVTRQIGSPATNPGAMPYEMSWGAPLTGGGSSPSTPSSPGASLKASPDLATPSGQKSDQASTMGQSVPNALTRPINPNPGAGPLNPSAFGTPQTQPPVPNLGSFGTEKASGPGSPLDTGGSAPTPYQAPGASPEANAAINQGTQAATGKPTDQPGQGVQGATYNPTTGQTTPTSTGAPPATTGAPQASTFKPPLALFGNSPQVQSKMLGDYLRSMGADPGNFVVGGTSPYDAQINGLIDQINSPSATDAQRKIYAQQMADLIKLRTQTAKPSSEYAQLFQYSPVSGSFQNIPGQNNDLNSMIAGLYNSSKPADGQGSPFSAQLMSLLNDFQGGNASNLAQQQQIAQGRLITDAENTSQSKRQALVDRLSAMGIQGGAASDAITQEENAALNSRDQGMASLQSNILQQQLASKSQALQAFLGMDQSSQANSLQRQMAQLQAAQTQQNNATNQSVTQRGQDINLGIANSNNQMNLLTHLLDLAWAGDQNAQNAVNQMISQLVTNPSSAAQGGA